ncbi:hypothetical protein UlMin_021981 [Ulmus minor]
MGRRPCCAKEGLNRGAWSAKEDKILTDYINVHGEGKWRDLPERAGLKRCGKSCRLRWLNYLRPDIKRGNISAEEEDLIVRLHKLLGNRWSLISCRLPGRTDNEIKNYWNTNLSKRVQGDNYQTLDPRKRHSAKNSVREQLNRSKESHQIIRTKAFRCSKVVINPRLLINQDDHHIDQMVNNKNKVNPSSEEFCTESQSSFSSALQEDDSSDFLIDFDIDGLLMSDVLNSSDDLKVSMEEDQTMFNNSLDNNISFEEQIRSENWRDSKTFQASFEGLDQINMGLSSFLNLEDDNGIF